MNIRSHGAGRADGLESPRRVSSGSPLPTSHLPGAAKERGAEAMDSGGTMSDNYCERCGTKCKQVPFMFSNVTGTPMFKGHCTLACWHTGHNYVNTTEPRSFLWFKWERTVTKCSLCGAPFRRYD